jgi:hypothetical protein
LPEELGLTQPGASKLISRLIDAPRELVFDAFTDVRHLSQWWGPEGFSTTTRAFEFRVGGEWIFMMHGPNGTDYPEWISWTEIARVFGAMVDSPGQRFAAAPLDLLVWRRDRESIATTVPANSLAAATHPVSELRSSVAIGVVFVGRASAGEASGPKRWNRRVTLPLSLSRTPMTVFQTGIPRIETALMFRVLHFARCPWRRNEGRGLSPSGILVLRGWQCWGSWLAAVELGSMNSLGATIPS